MKNLYNEFFHIPKEGKIRDKVMVARVAVMVIAMVACLLAMSLLTFAYFSNTVSFGTVKLQAATFDVNVVIKQIDGQIETEVPVTTAKNKHTAQLVAGKTYQVSLERAGTASTGYCVISAGESKYYTRQLGVDLNAPDQGSDSFIFMLTVAENTTGTENMTVTFTPCWGTSIYYGDTTGNPFYLTEQNNEATMTFTEPSGSGDEGEGTTSTTTVVEQATTTAEATTTVTETETTTLEEATTTAPAETETTTTLEEVTTTAPAETETTTATEAEQTTTTVATE